MIKLQILLGESWRTAEGVEHVRKLATSLGIKLTAEGHTTISAEMNRDDFAKMFQAPVQEIAPQPPGERDFGRSGGDVSGDLPIPEPLQKYVESITVASPYLRM
ncbi:MAG: hypothetical protein QOJ02_534 [Acidobacteriota bacterium]|jgi:hypothetical protein|nr:hypothetical protein [Acidobacteriota bacterium]